MTVGSGFGPDLLDPSQRKALAGSQFALPTAGGEFRPALRTKSLLLKCLSDCNRFGPGPLSPVYVYIDKLLSEASEAGRQVHGICPTSPWLSFEFTLYAQDQL